MEISSIYLANPREKQSTGGLGWGGTGVWKARENLGKFIIDNDKGETYLTDDIRTLSVPKAGVISFTFGYAPSIKNSTIDWAKSFLVVSYFGRSGLNTLVVPMRKGMKAVEGDEGQKLLSVE